MSRHRAPGPARAPRRPLTAAFRRTVALWRWTLGGLPAALLVWGLLLGCAAVNVAFAVRLANLDFIWSTGLYAATVLAALLQLIQNHTQEAS